MLSENITIIREDTEEYNQFQKEVGSRLFTMRVSKSLTQRELADRMNLTYATISHWESGDRLPRLNYIVEFARFYGCSTDYLLGLVDDPKSSWLSPVKPQEKQDDTQEQVSAIMDTGAIESVVSQVVDDKLKDILTENIQNIVKAEVKRALSQMINV